MKSKILPVILGIFLVSILLIQLSETKAFSKEDHKPQKEILLKSRQFDWDKIKFSRPLGPVANQHTEKYFIIQLDHIPSEKEKKDLQEKGIELLQYVPHDSWIAKANVGVKVPESVLYLEELRPEDKVDPAIFSGGDWFKDGEDLILRVRFFSADSQEQENILESYGEVLQTGESWLVKIPENKIFYLASENEVKWISPKSLPPKTFNDGSRSSSYVDYVQDTLGLNGTGVVIAEWDSGWAEATHNALTGRI
ncbi:MAG TPA: hypothetical protein VJB06_02910, partial [archaeon]|nr:hypothetical protein [archaeon]